MVTQSDGGCNGNDVAGRRKGQKEEERARRKNDKQLSIPLNVGTNTK